MKSPWRSWSFLDSHSGGNCGGEDFLARETKEDAEVLDAPLQPLPALRPAACLLPQVSDLPDLFSYAGFEGRDPGREESELVRER